MTDSIDGASDSGVDVASSDTVDSQSSTSVADSDASNASNMRSFEELFTSQQSRGRILPGMSTLGVSECCPRVCGSVLSSLVPMCLYEHRLYTSPSTTTIINHGTVAPIH